MKKIAVFYLLFPFLLFCIGWLKIWYALLIVLFSIYIFRLYCKDKNQGLSLRYFTKRQYIVMSLIAFLVSFLNGIGGFWSQSSDWMAKNPILNDLSSFSWPLIIDPSNWPQPIAEYVGNEQMAFVYYLFYYLPAAVVGQLFGISAARFALLIWTAIGIFLVECIITHFVLSDSKHSIKHIIFVLVLFSLWGGLDIIGHLLRLLYVWNPSIPLHDQRLYATWLIDEWCRPYFFYYASNWTSLYWCFNQCVPIWIIVSLIVSSRKMSFLGFFFSLLLMYSPWATMGLVPVLFFYIFRCLCSNKRQLHELLNVQNLLFPLLLLFIIGSYYMSNNTPLSEKGWYWKFMSNQQFFIKYFVFIGIELSIYFYCLRKDIKSNFLLQGACLTLLFIPFYKMTHWNDWLMRASIPSLSIICVFWIKWVFEHFPVYKKSIAIILVLSSFTACQLVFVTSYETIRNGHPVTTFEDKSFVNVEEMAVASLANEQFYAHNYKETFFWRYLAK